MEGYLSLGGNIVTGFAQTLLKHNQQTYHLCFDNYFTSVKTVAALKNISVKGISPVRENS